MMVFAHDFNKFPELTNTQIEELGFTSPHKQITSDFTAKVVRVHDGDTVTLRADFRDFDFPLRLLNIDAPEMNEGGEEARDWLRDRILNNEVIVLVNNKNRVDKYGRLLGSIMHMGMEVAIEMFYLGLVTTFKNRRETEIPKMEKMFELGQWF